MLPVERGTGLSQFGMRVAQSRLAAGDWVHIFPEGTRSRTGKMGPVRCVHYSCTLWEWAGLWAGDWVHIFPEGTCSSTGKMGPVRCVALSLPTRFLPTRRVGGRVGWETLGARRPRGNMLSHRKDAACEVRVRLRV